MKIRHGQRADLSRDANLHVFTRNDASEMLNVSPRTIATVKAVEKESPEKRQSDRVIYKNH